MRRGLDTFESKEISQAGAGRTRHARDFERRLLDEEGHDVATLPWHRIVPRSARVRGRTITSGHDLNDQLDTLWLAE